METVYDRIEADEKSEGGESVQMLFSCPKCGGELIENGASAKCPTGHSFDKSKHGYYNLLLSNKGGCHGDNKEMVSARRAHLGAGYYEPLADRIAALALEYTPPHGAVLDVGCGDGYYTEKVEKALSARDGEANIAAFDISKDAARELKKRCPSAFCAVASAYSVPVRDGAFSTVINAFSPFAREEVLRALCDGGIFIMAIPEAEHLFELKKILYKTPYKNELKNSAIEGFELLFDQRLSFKMELRSADAVLNLFRMTPYAYRTPRESAERLFALDMLEVGADFHLYVYRKV